VIEVALGRHEDASPHALWHWRAYVPSQIVPASNC
jgi:hypothetical protein